MKESYPDDIMLCFVQGFGDGDRMYNNIDKCKENEVTESNNNTKLSKRRHQKRLMVQIPNTAISEEFLEDACSPETADFLGEQVELRSGKLRLSAGDRSLRLPDVKRSLSDRFSAISDSNGKKPYRGLLTMRKTRSTGNFASGAAGGGCGAPRSAPATPLQVDTHPHPRASKHDKHAVKPLSDSAPSVRAGGAGSDGAADTTDGKAPSKARQKKFQRHFPQVGPEERVLNYYSCALVGDLLLQGHLYITKNYFAFYSNVFGYVTKLLIPITSVLRITKEKVARIIPNAVGVCTRDERHVFGSLLSRDSTYKLMTHVWKAARVPELAAPKPPISEVELDASEYSPEDDSSSAGGDHHDAPSTPAKRDTEAIISTVGAAVIQPALLTGSTAPKRDGRWGRLLMMLLATLLACSALVLAYRLYHARTKTQEELLKLSGKELYSELMRWRTRLHGRAANELHAFLTTNLLLLTKVSGEELYSELMRWPSRLHGRAANELYAFLTTNLFLLRCDNL